MVKTEQETITDWFNKTYKIRGELYLRPCQAYYVFLELLKVKKGDKILDIACGLGRLLQVANEYELNLFGIDISEIAVEKTKKLLPHSNVVEGNAEALPYADSNFNYITCIGSLERMLNREKVLEEMKRVIKPDGKICLMLRNRKSYWWIITKEWLGTINKKGHQDALSLEEWTVFLQDNGLKIEGCYPDQWPMTKFLRYISFGLIFNYKKIRPTLVPLENAYEFIFICSKK